MNVKTHYEVEYLRTGQTRSYGPTETEAILTISFTNFFGETRPSPNNDEWARRLGKVLIGWVDEPEADWASNRLVSMENIGEGKYKFLTRSPWLD